jgi:glycosyltransferase involved in cell wall biosynthesis
MIKPLVVIALYNHADTCNAVAEDSYKFCKDVLVVDDASTDGGAACIKNENIKILRLNKNGGKGNAILTAAKYALEKGFSHIITIDADAQHYPSDIACFLRQIQLRPNDIFIGVRDFSAKSIPRLSKFGRDFSGFWARVQTGKVLHDIQSGYRAYPVSVFGKFKIYTRHFDFEVEIIIKAIWAGFNVGEIPVKVFYPSKAERISHFKLLKDNARLAVLNTYLTIRAMLPVAHKKYIITGENIKPGGFFETIKRQMMEKDNPLKLGLSGAWGVFCGTLALPGIRNMILMWGVGWANLNRLIAFSLDKLAIPPFIPFVCIETGYFIRHGHFLTDASWQTIGRQFGQRVWEWFLGSLIVAPIFAILVGLIVFIVGVVIRRGLIHGREMDGKK